MIAGILLAVVVVLVAVTRAWRFGRGIQQYRDRQRQKFGGDR